MSILRSLLSLVLVLVTTLLVSCGNPDVAKVAPTYTPERLAQIEILAAPVVAARDRITEAESLLSARDWTDLDNLMHGPIGSLRRDLRYLGEALLPKEQKEVQRLSQEIFGHIERLDAASKARSYDNAALQYQEAVKDLDALLNVIPS